MSTDTLIGSALGAWTLQSVLRHGGIETVFLARDSNAERQVAIKTLNLAWLALDQRKPFLERFRHEAPQLISLKHPNILPVYECGQRNDLTFLVSPLIQSGILRDALEQEAPLPLPKALNLLEQLAAALDFAHARGILHLGLTPTTICKVANHHLLISDFGLVSILHGSKTLSQRMAEKSILPGELVFMAPEQMSGGPLDPRADLYALGVILYLSVTGKLPFPTSAGTAQQLAAQRLQTPPAPHTLRPELPLAVDQVMLRALTPHPANRYAQAQELVSAFRAALPPAEGAPQAPLPPGLKFPSRIAIIPSPAQHTTGKQEDDEQTTPMAARGLKSMRPARLSLAGKESVSSPPIATQQATGVSVSSEVVTSRPEARTTPLPAPRMRLSAFKSLLRPIEETGKIKTIPREEAGTSTTPAAGLPPTVRAQATQSWPTTNPLSTLPADAPGQADAEQNTSKRPAASPASSSSFSAAKTSGALPNPTGKQTAQSVKLTESVKVVQVPVAGQPGRYVTGLLSLSTKSQQLEELLPPAANHPFKTLTGKKRWLMLVACIFALIALLGTSSLLLSHLLPGKQAKRQQLAVTAAPNYVATIQAETTATAQANIILEDPLTQNIHNWPVVTSGAKTYNFSSAGYQIYDNDANHSAPAILPGITIAGPLVYTLTLEEIKGNDASINNSFGMILRFNIQNKGGHNVTTFYSFEVVNTKGGEYQFWKYDDSVKSPTSAWTPIWRHPFGSEFHVGHGPKSSNIFKVVANGKNFTFYVNGKKVGTAQNSAIAGGEIGMLVNLKGTEVAFSNLLLTDS